MHSLFVRELLGWSNTWFVRVNTFNFKRIASALTSFMKQYLLVIHCLLCLFRWYNHTWFIVSNELWQLRTHWLVVRNIVFGRSPRCNALPVFFNFILIEFFFIWGYFTIVRWFCSIRQLLLNLVFVVDDWMIKYLNILFALLHLSTLTQTHLFYILNEFKLCFFHVIINNWSWINSIKWYFIWTLTIWYFWV